VTTRRSGSPRSPRCCALLDALEQLQVDRARRQGWTWQRITAALGLSKQAVHKKYGGTRRLSRRRP
jgi:hypothetical protein